MADNDRPKLSTCPICGYTDTSDDADTLQMAIEEHIRMTHNLDPATLGGTAGSVRSVSSDTIAEVGGGNTNGVTIPVIAAAPNLGGAGGGTGSGTGYGAGAGLLAAEAINETAETNTKQRDDETSRF